jgi:hypothetical protein
MPRFLRYEDALAWVRGRTRLTEEELARGLNASPATAATFLRRMEAEGVIGLAGPDGAHPVLGERRRRWSAEPPPVTADPWSELARLRTEMEMAARRAEVAEARLAAHAAPGERIAVLRRLLVRELHPDAAAPADDPGLQAAYAEVFKRVWPRIERVLDGAPDSPEAQAG